MNRRMFCLATAVTLAGFPLVSRAETFHATLYKNPDCSYCDDYAAYLRDNGFAVDVKPTNDLAQISLNAGIPENLQGCHTMFIDGYLPATLAEPTGALSYSLGGAVEHPTRPLAEPGR